jgi:hypothetical protein
MQVTFEIDDDEISKLVRRELVWYYKTCVEHNNLLEAKGLDNLQTCEKEDYNANAKAIPALETVIACYSVGGEFDPSEIEDEDDDEMELFSEEGFFDEDEEGTEDDLK